MKIDPKAVRVEHVRHFLKIQNCSCHVYKNLLGALEVFFRDFLNRLDVVKSFKFPKPGYKPKFVSIKKKYKDTLMLLIRRLDGFCFLFYASSGLGKNEVFGLTKDCINFEKRMIISSGPSGATKTSYVSFYNGETEKNCIKSSWEKTDSSL